MQEYIARENIKRFREQLRRSSDEEEKAVLRSLLKQEEEKLGKPAEPHARR